LKFKIIGTKKIDDKEPGEIIDLQDLDQILTLTQAGHIEKIKKVKKIKKENK
tara:strand:- start:164 stop:319 length:156 start_codon:yes stop_codon:yes gene_type:complete